MIILVLGVSGCGKTTLAKSLNTLNTNSIYLEADDYHPRSNIEKMKSGTPLNDEDRKPWLIALNTAIKDNLHHSKAVYLACSALKLAYREILFEGINEPKVYKFWINTPKNLLLQRLQHRENHFMPASLLDSQLSIFQHDDSLIELDGALTIESLILITQKIINTTYSDDQLL